MAYSLLYYLPRDVARRAPETQHLPGQFVREAQDAGDDRVVASRTVARAVGRRAAAEHQASQSEHLLARHPPTKFTSAPRRKSSRASSRLVSASRGGGPSGPYRQPTTMSRLTPSWATALTSAPGESSQATTVSLSPSRAASSIAMGTAIFCRVSSSRLTLE